MAQPGGIQFHNALQSAFRLLKAIHAADNKTKARRTAEKSLIFSSELSAIAELQALLFLQLFGSSVTGNDVCIDIGSILNRRSIHEELLLLRSRVLSQQEQYQEIESVKKFISTKEDIISLNTYVSSVHTMVVKNAVRSELILDPFVKWHNEDVTANLKVVLSLLLNERLKVQSKEDVLNDDLFALLRLCNKLPYTEHDNAEGALLFGDPSGVPKCRRLYMYHAFLECIKYLTSGGLTNDTIPIYLYTGTATALTNVCIDLLEHSQTHKPEEQLLGLSLMYNTINLCSTSDLIGFLPWLLPKLHHMLSYIKEGAPYTVLNLAYLSVLYSTRTSTLAIMHSHKWLLELARHLSMYRNRESMIVDICLLHRGMRLAMSDTVVACHISTILPCLLSTLQFWQPLVQEITLLCIYQLLKQCPEAMFFQLRKINLELFRLSAYYVPILNQGVSGDKTSGHDSTLCSQADINSLICVICNIAVYSKSLHRTEFEGLLNVFSEADATSARYVQEKTKEIEIL